LPLPTAGSDGAGPSRKSRVSRPKVAAKNTTGGFTDFRRYLEKTFAAWVNRFYKGKAVVLVQAFKKNGSGTEATHEYLSYGTDPALQQWAKDNIKDVFLESEGFPPARQSCLVAALPDEREFIVAPADVVSLHARLAILNKIMWADFCDSEEGKTACVTPGQPFKQAKDNGVVPPYWKEAVGVDEAGEPLAPFESGSLRGTLSAKIFANIGPKAYAIEMAAYRKAAGYDDDMDGVREVALLSNVALELERLVDGDERRDDIAALMATLRALADVPSAQPHLVSAALTKAAGEARNLAAVLIEKAKSANDEGEALAVAQARLLREQQAEVARNVAEAIAMQREADESPPRGQCKKRFACTREDGHVGTHNNPGFVDLLAAMDPCDLWNDVNLLIVDGTLDAQKLKGELAGAVETGMNVDEIFAKACGVDLQSDDMQEYVVYYATKGKLIWTDVLEVDGHLDKLIPSAGGTSKKKSAAPPGTAALKVKAPALKAKTAAKAKAKAKAKKAELAKAKAEAQSKASVTWRSGQGHRASKSAKRSKILLAKSGFVTGSVARARR
jgi:hypothetical protein